VVRLIDLTAGSAVRVQILISWAAGVPTPSVVAGSGVAYTAEAVAAFPGWYRIPHSADGVIGANTNQWHLYPASTTLANTGTCYFFGANAWNETTPARYAGPSQAAGVLGSTLYLNGATASVSNWIRAGDLLSAVVGSGVGVWEATADTNSQANGYVPVPINFAETLE
jgi:hypothetical protein